MKIRLRVVFFALVTLLFAGCSKSSSDPKPVTKGTFTFQSSDFDGNCTSVTSGNNSANINVQITGSSGSFIIYNMPKVSSGSFVFTDGYSSINNANNLYAFLTISPSYASVSGGSLTKTGARTFTFSCDVYYVLDAGTHYTVTGSGAY